MTQSFHLSIQINYQQYPWRSFFSMHNDSFVQFDLNDYIKPQPFLIGDIIPNILSYCDAQTLSRASCVCHEWRSIALSNELWENLCKQRFNISADQIKPRPDPTKLLYIWTYERFREACRGQLDPRDAFTGLRGGLESSLPTIPMSAFRLS